MSVTLTAWLVERRPPSLSAAVSVTTYAPSSSGVKPKAGPVPAAYASPSLVTAQDSSRPAATSAPDGSVAAPATAIRVPSGLVDGAAAVNCGVGATLETRTTWLVERR